MTHHCLRSRRSNARDDHDRASTRTRPPTPRWPLTRTRCRWPSSVSLRIACQAQQLLDWAAPFEDRAWAVEPADWHCKLVSQQLVANTVHVIDVASTLVARVGLLGPTKAWKNDHLSTTIAGLRHRGLQRVAAYDRPGCSANTGPPFR